MSTNDDTHILHGRYARQRIAEAIARSNRYIDLLAYAISPAPIMDSTLQPSIFSTLLQLPARNLQCCAIIASHAQHSPHEAANSMAATELHRHGWQVLRYPVKPVMHAKLLILDRRRIIMGSHNMTTAALEHNRELSIITSNAHAVSDAFDFFNKLHEQATPYGQDKRAS